MRHVSILFDVCNRLAINPTTNAAAPSYSSNIQRPAVQQPDSITDEQEYTYLRTSLRTQGECRAFERRRAIVTWDRYFCKSAFMLTSVYSQDRSPCHYVFQNSSSASFTKPLRMGNASATHDSSLLFYFCGRLPRDTGRTLLQAPASSMAKREEVSHYTDPLASFDTDLTGIVWVHERP